LNYVYDRLKDNFDGELDNKELVEGAKRGMVAATGDKYTAYMSAKEAEEFKKDLEGDFGAGIGVEIGLRNDWPTVVRLLDDNPAKRAGVKAGDVFVEVNDESVAGWTVEEVSNKVRGEDGTSVKVKFLRGDHEVGFTMTREQINNPSVELSFKDDVAVLAISRFDSETGRLAEDAAKKVNERKVNKVILDLRGNGGGYTDAAQEVLSLWVKDEKTLFTERSRGKVVSDVVSLDGDSLLAGKKTVVLVNGTTASAGEIVAGALQDYKLATLLGEQTYGKGSVQRTLDLNNGGLLKVTIANWYTPNGVNLNKSGIEPDQEVKLTLKDLENGKDTQLLKALELLN
jgi:carboxyl-terminal processing protease